MLYRNIVGKTNLFRGNFTSSAFRVFDVKKGSQNRCIAGLSGDWHWYKCVRVYRKIVFKTRRGISYHDITSGIKQDNGKAE